MCTAITYQTKDHYFGRTLDYTFSYAETVTVCPRKYPFIFREMPKMEYHYAIIGMAYVLQEYPLFYDGTNEKGLSMAGLNFPGNAYYGPVKKGKINLAPFELIPYILGKCESVEEAKGLLEQMNLAQIAFSEELPPSPLHWIVADKKEAITVEATREGLAIYQNPVGVLTNNPPFREQMFLLNRYRNLMTKTPENTFSDQLSLEVYCEGLGGLGLPGDMTSDSRFVRAAFTKLHAVSGMEEKESVRQFFHILGAVGVPRGVVEGQDGAYEITIYTSCCNTEKGIYYYTTYENPTIRGVDMHKESLETSKLVSYPLQRETEIIMEN